jgi:hypothetical protein
MLLLRPSLFKAFFETAKASVQRHAPAPSVCNRLLGIFRGILSKPFRDRRHILLKVARDRKVQNSRSV